MDKWAQSGTRGVELLLRRTYMKPPSRAPARPPSIVMREMMVPGADPGIEIFVRNKHPIGMTFQPERTVLFVHGATYPASATFDLALDGMSWMDYIASDGFDVYLLDLRGYGRSTRPSEMAGSAIANPPIVRGNTAVKDIANVIDFILQRRNIPTLSLIGWSWGGTLIGSYASAHALRVCRLVQYGPPWVCAKPQRLSGQIAAYRTLTREQIGANWYRGVPADKRAQLIPAGWFNAWAESVWESDPVGTAQNPAAIRAPNGVLQDIREFHCAGEPYYDAAKITGPTLLVVAQWDQNTPAHMAHALLPLLINSPGKRLVELAEGTHNIMLEKNRMELFRTVQDFLNEEGIASFH